MTIETEHVGRDGGSEPAEVVAGLVNDDTAPLVARASVALATDLGCGLRFVHALRPGQEDDGSSAVFDTAMRAVRGTAVRATFEVAHGDPADVLVDRSRGARVLVVATDRPALPEDETTPTTATTVAGRAACRIELVDRPGSGTVAIPGGPDGPRRG